ncbi:Nicotinamide/nicotinic acid mononucleotide adenylyltransferase 1 [Podospora bellae-mahoneyi]|uniref:Nicotinamide/nicotinic acid mononucleotide adenylyltransferase 1 n=1 Tax=Podospora bellae-mahoneyi TaxID=2093777 RepID=A0ABR0FJK4_9PEZI|nr:Nicotinamide/nicotinic acid mononucleotide adenylyltransferase 1 [Podospora bellae-mahoneyi]
MPPDRLLYNSSLLRPPTVKKFRFLRRSANSPGILYKTHRPDSEHNLNLDRSLPRQQFRGYGSAFLCRQEISSAPHSSTTGRASAICHLPGLPPNPSPRTLSAAGMDPAIIAARDNVIRAEVAEREAECILMAARENLLEAREHALRLELEASAANQAQTMFNTLTSHNTTASGTATPVAVSGVPTEAYTFPVDKLRRRQTRPGKTPLILVACGSFSPITFLHMRMFEMASDFVRFNTDFEVCAGYLSPVSDAYKKAGLAPGRHRVEMCSRAIESSPWLMVDPFETVNCNEKGEPEYVPTAKVLRHFDHEINTVLGGIEGTDGKMHKAKIALLAGADLVMSMGEPGLWSPIDLGVILGQYGAFIVERSGTDIELALSTLKQYENNIWVIGQVIQNDISSTKVRLFLKKDLSVRYLIPDPVVEYINEHHLYQEGPPKEKQEKINGSKDPGPESSNGKLIKG